jgi:hypothetical protein
VRQGYSIAFADPRGRQCMPISTRRERISSRLSFLSLKFLQPNSGNASDDAHGAHQTDMMAFGHILCPDAVPAGGSRAKCEDGGLLCHPVTQCRQPLFSLLHGDHRLSFQQFIRQVTRIFLVEWASRLGVSTKRPQTMTRA